MQVRGNLLNFTGSIAQAFRLDCHCIYYTYNYTAVFSFSLHYKVYLTALMKENGINISEGLARSIVQTSSPADATTCSVI